MVKYAGGGDLTKYGVWHWLISSSIEKKADLKTFPVWPPATNCKKNREKTCAEDMAEDSYVRVYSR